MKRLLALLLAAAMLFCTAGCGGASSKLSDNNTRTAKVIINAVDDYLDGNADAEETYDIVDTASDELIDEDTSSYMSFDAKVLSIKSQLLSMKLNNSGDVGKIEDYRNDIAALIGEADYKG